MPDADHPVTLDDLDHRILAVIQDDASLSNLALAARVHTSPPTCLRRLRRLTALGVIERQVAIVSPRAFGPAVTAIIEVTLEQQSEDHQDAFAERVGVEQAVLQSYRVSPGPDFVLIAQVADMPAYQALARRLFGPSSNVRNLRAFFALRRTKFDTRIARAG
jgi:Lrp/AsnC family transcriptional regulator, leucine-responsive regulatory protein